MGEQERTYTVITPNPNFNGRRYGVLFKDGKGKATKHEAEVLVGNWGYRCPELEKEAAQESAEQQTETQEETPQADQAKAKKKNKNK